MNLTPLTTLSPRFGMARISGTLTQPNVMGSLMPLTPAALNDMLDVTHDAVNLSVLGERSTMHGSLGTKTREHATGKVTLTVKKLWSSPGIRFTIDTPDGPNQAQSTALDGEIVRRLLDGKAQGHFPGKISLGTLRKGILGKLGFRRWISGTALLKTPVSPRG